MSAEAQAPLAEAAPRQAGEAALARIHLFDTTLRDGAQTTGVDFSLDDMMPTAPKSSRLKLASLASSRDDRRQSSMSWIESALHRRSSDDRRVTAVTQVGGEENTAPPPSSSSICFLKYLELIGLKN